MTEQIRFYHDVIAIYGLAPLLMALDHFENKEDYEECACIMIALKQLSRQYKAEIKTRFDNSIIDEDVEYINYYIINGEPLDEKKELVTKISLRIDYMKSKRNIIRMAKQK